MAPQHRQEDPCPSPCPTGKHSSPRVPCSGASTPTAWPRWRRRPSRSTFPAERTIARQGEIGTGLFIVAEGAVRVVRDGEVIAHLGPGEFFGELSVLDGGPRNASVIADGPTTCLALATWDAERVLREQPGVALAVLRVLAQRLREATADHRT